MLNLQFSFYRTQVLLSRELILGGSGLLVTSTLDFGGRVVERAFWRQDGGAYILEAGWWSIHFGGRKVEHTFRR